MGLRMQVAGRLDVPETGAKAVALNLTAVRAEAAGFVKAYPGGADEPPTSSLNFTNPGQIVPNHAITSLNTTNGQITIKPSEESHIVVDASGLSLSASIRSGDRMVPQAIRALDDAGVDVLDVQVRRPTLDDVFLQLTGRAADSDGTSGAVDIEPENAS